MSTKRDILPQSEKIAYFGDLPLEITVYGTFSNDLDYVGGMPFEIAHARFDFKLKEGVITHITYSSKIRYANRDQHEIEANLENAIVRELGAFPEDIDDSNEQEFILKQMREVETRQNQEFRDILRYKKLKEELYSTFDTKKRQDVVYSNDKRQHGLIRDIARDITAYGISNTNKKQELVNIIAIRMDYLHALAHNLPRFVEREDVTAKYYWETRDGAEFFAALNAGTDGEEIALQYLLILGCKATENPEREEIHRKHIAEIRGKQLKTILGQNMPLISNPLERRIQEGNELKSHGSDMD